MMVRLVIFIVLLLQIISPIYAVDFGALDKNKYANTRVGPLMDEDPKFLKMNTAESVQALKTILESNDEECGVLCARCRFFARKIPRKRKFDKGTVDAELYWDCMRVVGDFKMLSMEMSEKGVNGASDFEDEVGGLYYVLVGIVEVLSKDLDDKELVAFTNKCVELTHASPKDQIPMFKLALEDLRLREAKLERELRIARVLCSCLGIKESCEERPSDDEHRIDDYKLPSEIVIKGRTLLLKVNKNAEFQLCTQNNTIVARGRCGVEKNATIARLRGIAAWNYFEKPADEVARHMQFDYLGADELTLRVRSIDERGRQNWISSISKGNRWGFCWCANLKDNALEYLYAILGINPETK